MPPRPPLSTPLSNALVAFTIELDNEFERRFEEAGSGARSSSLVMWSNLLRFVGDGIAVGELPDAVGLQKPRVLSTLGGVERWRYVYVTPTRRGGAPKARRDGYGSARGLEDGWFVRLTRAGKKAAAIWPGLPAEIGALWRARFGLAAVDELRSVLSEVVRRVEVGLPAYLPIVGSANGMALDLPQRERRDVRVDPSLSALLSRVLLAYTIDFENRSALSLPLSANVLRILDDRGIPVRDLPARSGISKEAIAMSLTFLAKTDYVDVEGGSAASETASLTPAGMELRDGQWRLHARIERSWADWLGHDVVARLRSSLEALLRHPELGAGLEPPPGGWRARTPYASQTRMLVAAPQATLPHYPMVLHRGGWPDGS